MKHKILFSWENKKIISNLSSAEFSQSALSVKFNNFSRSEMKMHPYNVIYGIMKLQIHCSAD